MSDDESQLTGAKSTSSAAPTQTQPDVNRLITDIFGEESDDEDVVVNKKRPATSFTQSDDEDDLVDSDDDAPKKKKPSSVSLGASGRPIKPGKAKSSGERIPKKKKKKEGRVSERSRRAVSSSSGGGLSGAASAGGTGGSSDEYDSADEANLQTTADDDAFIDRDDDLDDIAQEYNADKQNFDDERPMKPTKSSGEGRERVTKDSDPLSQTLDMIKKPKKEEMNEQEKTRIVTELLTKMELAARKDDDCFRRKEPAVHKLAMLKAVEQIVSMKQLQMTLLDYDILSVMKDWIEPKDSNALPSLTVRTAVYHMLLKLPCQLDHLKRVAPGKQPIGVTIVALRKHKQETIENKRLLKELMEKWSRPVFGKSTDARSAGASRQSNNELREACHARMIAKEDEQRAAGLLNESRAGPTEGGGLDLLNKGAAKTSMNESFKRARTPYSNGFLFTVQPEYAKVSSSARPRTEPRHEKETHKNLLKLMNDKGGKTGVSKKANPRAVSMALTGRNKS